LNFDGEWVKELKIEDVPRAFRPLVETLGIEGAAKLSNAYPGMSIYVPKPETLFERLRNDLIRRDLRTMSYREVARKYGLTEQWIRQIGDHNAGRKDEADDRQIDMFATG
jgi:Mor family transcriptional regulator